MAEKYGEEYFREAYGAGELRRFGSAWFSARYYAAVSRRLLRASGGRRVLEIGCGHGFVLGFLAGEFEVAGVDLSEYALGCARKNVPGAELVRASVEEGLPDLLAGRTFDLVLAKYVLEHLARPEGAVRAAFEALRPGGLLFFSVPNTDSLGRRLKGEACLACRDRTHVSLLAPGEWLRVAERAGFEIVREAGDGYWDLPYLRWLPRWVQAPFFLPPTALMCLSGRLILPARFGENILVVARRPAP